MPTEVLPERSIAIAEAAIAFGPVGIPYWRLDSGLVSQGGEAIYGYHTGAPPPPVRIQAHLTSRNRNFEINATSIDATRIDATYARRKPPGLGEHRKLLIVRSALRAQELFE
jgi:hypothetical protein